MKTCFCVIFTVCAASFFKSSDGINIKPAEQEIYSSQLCPNPVSQGAIVSNPGMGRMMPVILDKGWKSYERFSPCTFTEEVGPGMNASSVKVRSINLNVESWNFSTANKCDSFIRFRDSGAYGDGFQVMCGRENFDQYLGPYGHPMVLYYRWTSRGISFPLFHSSYGPHFRDRKETNELRYMQIYFAIYTNHTWSCRVQQYKLDLSRMGCPASYNSDVHCGDYNCSELEFLYQHKMTVFKEGETDKILVWKTRTSDKYRMRNFLRQKFVPIVFLVVLIFAYKSYMKAGFRLQGPSPANAIEAATRLRRLPRSFSNRPYCPRELRQSYWEYGEHIPEHMTPTYGMDAAVPPVDPTVVVHGARPKLFNPYKSDDLPPSYSDVLKNEYVAPPSYSEVFNKETNSPSNSKKGNN